MITRRSTTRIMCIRHGETDWNAAGRWQGHAPVPLNEAGLEQSAALGRYLGHHMRDRADSHSDNNNGSLLNAPLSALYSSDLKRAIQTAEAIAIALNLEIRPDPRLREVHLGQWQGLTRQEVQTWDRERYDAHRKNRYRVAPPGGENHSALRDRMRAAFDEIAGRHAGQIAALVSHGAALGMLIESLFGHIERPSLSNTSITLVEQAEPGAPWKLVQVAWTPHLDGAPLGETW